MKTWLNRNVWTLSWVSFLQDAASELLYPIMPVLLTSVLHAPAAVVGMIEGLAEGVAATMKLGSAWINKFLPRKVAVFIGYALAGVGKVIIAAAGAWPIVLIGRLTDRVGKGMRSAPRDALLLLGSDRAHRGKVVGFHRTADTLGAVLGPVLALSLLAAFNNDIRPVLWFAAIPATMSTLLVLAVKDHEPRVKRVKATDASAASASSPAAADPITAPEPLSRRLKIVLGVISGFAFMNFPDALLLLHVSQIGFSLSAVVGAYLLYNISYAALNFPFGWLSDRLSPSGIYALGLVCFAAAYGGMSLTKDHSLTLLLIVIYGGFAAANDTVGKSWVSKLAPESRQLWAQSLLQGFSGFGVLAAGLWAGALWTIDGGLGSVPLMIAGVAALAVAAVLLLMGRD
jgi:MFS family permease